MREYIVCLNPGVDTNAFWDEIEQIGSQSPHVPSRIVNILDERLMSELSCHYELTDAEAQTLRQDPRVFCVEIPIEQQDWIKVETCAVQTGTYSKSDNIFSNGKRPFTGVNWGLFRINSATNNTTEISGPGTYNYTLDGSGVDFVIQDTGLQCDHPEFQDANGISRVQKINWWTEAGNVNPPPWTPSSNPADNGMPAGFYTDTNGHGTICAGIAAGKTYGRAKNSNIYVMKIILGDNLIYNQGALPILTSLDLIKKWHQNKPVDPITGYKRPTVVNMSWGSSATFKQITGVQYRTEPFRYTNTAQTQWGMNTPWSYIQDNLIYSNPNPLQFPYRTGQKDSAITEMINAGIIICAAAGNDSKKIDIPASDGGTGDYNNYYTSSSADWFPVGAPIYYMRGTSPGSTPGVICVGSIGLFQINNTNYSNEYKAQYSNNGPRIDIWSPGTYIWSAISNSNELGVSLTQYPDNQIFLVGEENGTSQASPQVAGMCAQLLQVYPQATPAQIGAKIISDGKQNMLYDNTGPLSNNYTNVFALNGAPNRYAYMPFNTDESLTISGPVEINNVTITT